MLKITVQNTPGAVTLILEGAVAGNWVPELRRTWQSLLPSLDQTRISVDLRGVTRVDTDGKQLLAEMNDETSMDFVADTPLTRYFVEEATRDDGKGRSKGDLR